MVSSAAEDIKRTTQREREQLLDIRCFINDFWIWRGLFPAACVRNTSVVVRLMSCSLIATRYSKENGHPDSEGAEYIIDQEGVDVYFYAYCKL